jgi:multiple sugar transport system substrate-binding protein
LIKNLPDGDEIMKRLEEGITWSELIKIKSQYFPKNPAYVFQGDAYEGLICNYIEMLGKDADGIYNNGKFQLNSNAILEKTKLFIDLVHQYNLAPKRVANFDEGKSFEYALNNDIPFFRGWPTTVKYSNLVSKTTEKLHLLKEAQLPRHDGDRSFSTLGGWNFILSKYSKVKEEAVIFIKFLLSKKMQELNYTSGSYLPILKLFYTGEHFLNKYPKFQTFTRLLNNGVHRPASINYTKISDIISLRIDLALKKELCAEEALRSIQKEIDNIQKSSK